MTNPRKLRLALVLLLPTHALVLGAGFFAPYGPSAQNRSLPFVPPTRLHCVDAQGKLHLRPFVYPDVAVPGSFAAYRQDRTQPSSLRFFVRDANGILHLFGTDGRAPAFLLGTDVYGRDQLSRMLLGGRISLLAGAAAAALSVALGTLVGSLAGFYEGLADGIMMRLTELFMALPWLYLLFAVRAFLPLRTPPQESFLLLITVIGMVGWARPARLVRGAVLSAKEQPYVLAARGFGASDAYLLRRHILPQTLGVVATQLGLLTPHYLLAEVALSYLGLGIGEPAPSLGKMLAELRLETLASAHWWMFLPAVLLTFIWMGYCYLTDALHEPTGLGPV